MGHLFVPWTYLSLKSFISERILYSLVFFVWCFFVILNNVTENLLGTYKYSHTFVGHIVFISGSKAIGATPIA